MKTKRPLEFSNESQMADPCPNSFGLDENATLNFRDGQSSLPSQEIILREAPN